MCTLTFAWRRFDDHLAVAANRDEALARPSSPPAIRDGDPRVFAPRDEEAGGTWLGYNEAGVFVALTNRWTRAVTDGDRSRGLLVREALDRPDASAAAGFVRDELDARTYEPFHLLVADAERALLFEHDRDTSVAHLAPGVYVVGNTGWCGVRSGPAGATEPQRTESFFVPDRRPEVGREQAANDRRVLDTLAAAAEGADADAWLARGGEVLSDHEYGVCIHGDGFGTKSSSLVRLGAERAWRHAEGPPCETPYEPLDAL
ncbi:NRDE family protein [Halosegnis marinus]|uniref:NRDE family protein n=1 Tax=Halosegnis marinus TaxID=3034023 RepID=A0ABD5ZRS1_9EURY|nr:NRDE family protein [Halosegnis sp. DT85]